MDLPDELRGRLPPLYSQEAEAEPVVHAKYCLPGSSRAWYVLEGQPDEQDFVFFGFVAGIADEFSQFRLSELLQLRGTDGQAVTLDPGFMPGRLTDTVPAPDL